MIILLFLFKHRPSLKQTVLPQAYPESLVCLVEYAVLGRPGLFMFPKAVCVCSFGFAMHAGKSNLTQLRQRELRGIEKTFNWSTVVYNPFYWVN